MRIPCLVTLVVASVVAAERVSASPITLRIAYDGMPANAQNEISSITLTESSGSFTHPISNISPDLLQLVVQGAPLSNLTFTLFDAAISLGSLMFTDVVLTSFALAPDGTSDQISFVFDSPGQGFYTIDYPGIPVSADKDISSLTLDQTGASFQHQISSLSPQLSQFVAFGVLLPSVTLIPVDAASPFEQIAFKNVLFTSIAGSASDPLGLLEDVSFVFSELAIESPGLQVAEPSVWLMTLAGAVALRRRRRRDLLDGIQKRSDHRTVL